MHLLCGPHADAGDGCARKATASAMAIRRSIDAIVLPARLDGPAKSVRVGPSAEALVAPGDRGGEAGEQERRDRERGEPEHHAVVGVEHDLEELLAAHGVL